MKIKLEKTPFGRRAFFFEMDKKNPSKKGFLGLG
jgi:hypothetical protein